MAASCATSWTRRPAFDARCPSRFTASVRKAAFYLFQDRTRNVEIVGDGVMPINGHNTYLPIGDSPQWILNDTYPDRTRRQTPYLYHIPTGRRVDPGHFYLPPEYQGE